VYYKYFFIFTCYHHIHPKRTFKVALGLFVTTQDLPPYPSNHEYLSYDCSFDSDCRSELNSFVLRGWASIGGTMDHWRIARGEPDSLLWLAATGTMQLPREPFVLIEQRGDPVDALMTDEIRCQKGSADLSFIYWAIDFPSPVHFCNSGSADLEICLTDINGERFNCTGMLASTVMPGKVYLKIPEIQKPFRIMIASNNLPGVLVITTTPTTTTEPTTTTTTEAATTLPTTTEELPTEEVTVEEITSTSSVNSVTERKTPPPFPTLPSTSTEIPFELMVLGNKTRPLFDRRTGNIVTESAKLLCDFNNEFACQWGAEAGRWAIIEKGAIPSLEESVDDPSLLPSYPAALVLQGTAMLTSDPVRCQSGPGKVIARESKLHIRNLRFSILKPNCM
ncbi:unnamed protein product, partial [Strongylus vulgaris]